MTLDLFVLLSAPLVVGGVIGAWVATGRLFVARMGGVRLPVWIPWVITPVIVLAGLVIIATQLISASASLVVSPAAGRGAAAILALLLSPAWTGGAALAVLGMVLHYVLDDALALLRLHPVIFEGLAEGIRAAWAVIGLLTLFFGLQQSYSTAVTVHGVLFRAGAYSLVMNGLTIAMAVFGMAAPHWLEGGHPRGETSTPRNNEG